MLVSYPATHRSADCLYTTTCSRGKCIWLHTPSRPLHCCYFASLKLPTFCTYHLCVSRTSFFLSLIIICYTTPSSVLTAITSSSMLFNLFNHAVFQNKLPITSLSCPRNTNNVLLCVVLCLHTIYSCVLYSSTLARQVHFSDN